MYLQFGILSLEFCILISITLWEVIDLYTKFLNILEHLQSHGQVILWTQKVVFTFMDNPRAL